MDHCYVIGLNNCNLIAISESFDLISSSKFITQVIHHCTLIDATIIEGRSTAERLVKEIKERYNEISVKAQSVFESIIDGDDINPNELKIFELVILLTDD